MKKNSMRLLGFILVAMMLVSLFAVNVFAEDATNANVAKIGDTEYATLADAIAAAMSGDTITFLADITEDVTISKKLTIDGADFTYTGTMTLNNVTVTIENVNFVKGQVYKNKNTGSNANITIKNCDFDGQGLNAYAINVGGSNSITIENVTAKDYGYGLLQIPSSCAALTVKDVEISDCYYGLKVDYANAVTLEKVTIADDVTIGIYDSNFGAKTYTIKDSTISSIKIWERSAAKTTTFKFVGDNTVGSLPVSSYAKINVEEGATLLVPKVSINGEKYATLADAIAAAKSGDTITFLADITEDVTISKKLTIDGAGKTYTGKMTLKADTTIKNVNFDGKGYNGYAVETRGANYVTIEDCTATNYGYGFVQLVSGTVLTTVKNVTVSNMNYGVKIDYSNAVVLENVDMTANVAAVLNSNYGEKTITIKNSKLNIYGTWTRNNTVKTTIVFEGANTIGQFVDDEAIDVYKLAAGATLTAPAGKAVATDVEGYVVAYENGAYAVVEKKNYVVQIGEQGYESLAEAIAAAKAGDTITFLADITEDVTVSKKVTIDGAGKTYTGKMTLKADTTIKNVNFDGKGYNGYAVETRGANYVTIEGCTATNYGYGFVQLVSGTVLTTVKNVTVSNVNYGVKIDYSTAVVLENVDMTAGVAAVLNSNYGEKTVTIKDSKLNILGTWTRNNTKKTTYVFEGANEVGEFKTDAAIDIFKLANVNSTLTAPAGEAITTDVEDMIVAYKNGTYYVSKYYEAEINGVPYETLQAAIAAAQNGDTIVLLENIDLSNVSTQLLDGKYNTYFLVEGKDITVDLNGKTISGVYTASSMLVGVFSTDHDGKLTLTGNGTIDVTAEGTIYSLIVAFSDGASIIIENGTYKADKVSDSLIYYGGKTDAAVTVKGGTFELGNVGDGSNGKPWIFNVLGAADHYVYITGGTFNANVNRQHWSSEAVVDKTCYVVDNGDGTWTVKAGAVAYVNTGMTSGQFYIPKDVGYATFEEAIAAALAHNDGPVTLLADVVLTGIVDATGITINQNGFAIVLTTKDAALIAPEGLNVTTDIENLSVAYVNGTYKAIVALVENKTTGKVYESLADALADAKTTEGADVIVLLGDITAGAILVDEDITLDLQNYTLTITEGLVVFNGGYITGNPYKASNEKNAQIIGNVAVTGTYSDGEASYMLVPMNGAYVFTRAAILDTPSEANPERGVTYDEATDTYNAQFKVKWDAFMMDAEDGVLVNGTYAEHGIKIVILVTWDGGEQDYYYSDADVQACSAMNPDGQNYDYTFALKANGRENLTITIMAVADCGTIAAN